MPTFSKKTINEAFQQSVREGKQQIEQGTASLINAGRALASLEKEFQKETLEERQKVAAQKKAAAAAQKKAETAQKTAEAAAKKKAAAAQKKAEIAAQKKAEIAQKTAEAAAKKKATTAQKKAETAQKKTGATTPKSATAPRSLVTYRPETKIQAETKKVTKAWKKGDKLYAPEKPISPLVGIRTKGLYGANLAQQNPKAKNGFGDIFYLRASNGSYSVIKPAAIMNRVGDFLYIIERGTIRVLDIRSGYVFLEGRKEQSLESITAYLQENDFGLLLDNKLQEYGLSPRYGQPQYPEFAGKTSKGSGNVTGTTFGISKNG